MTEMVRIACQVVYVGRPSALKEHLQDSVANTPHPSDDRSVSLGIQQRASWTHLCILVPEPEVSVCSADGLFAGAIDAEPLINAGVLLA